VACEAEVVTKTTLDTVDVLDGPAVFSAGCDEGAGAGFEAAAAVCAARLSVGMTLPRESTAIDLMTRTVVASTKVVETRRLKGSRRLGGRTMAVVMGMLVMAMSWASRALRSAGSAVMSL
jgi:hypothetical protein